MALATTISSLVLYGPLDLMEPKGLQGIRVPYRVIASGCGNLIRFSNLWAGLESLLRLDLSRSDQIVSKRIAYTNWA